MTAEPARETVKFKKRTHKKTLQQAYHSRPEAASGKAKREVRSRVAQSTIVTRTRKKRHSRRHPPLDRL